ncbi:MAG: hypothetical protein U9P14_05775 [Gemmatimonadota bacterium]|nr:hypothetical protein [Gemmatimonadota bacterium]
MEWVDSHIMQLGYWFNFIAEMLPVVLVLAIIFTFFLIQSFARQLSRITYFLDRIDNHLREITYFIKENEVKKSSPEHKRDKPQETDG